MGHHRYVRAVMADDPKFLYPLSWGNQNIDWGVYGAPLISSGDNDFDLVRKRPMVGAPDMMGFFNKSKSTPTTSTNFYNASFMMEAWVRVDRVATVNRIASCSITGNPTGHLLDLVESGTLLRFLVGDTAGGGFLSAALNYSTFAGGILHRPLHLVGATDGARADLWVNGQLAASDTSTAGSRYTTTPQLFIGRYNASNTGYFEGGIAMVAGYHKYDTDLALRHYKAALANPRRPL